MVLFERWLEAEPDNPVATHLLTAWRGVLTPAQCSRQYVEQTFDGFAHHFEATLDSLKYRAPQRTGDYLAELGLPAASLDVLDLGCGTGLVGEHVQPFVRELTGVDLSGGMLALAAEKRLYHHLCNCDIAEFLSASCKRYDLVICMDTFIYIGRLDEVLALICRNLNTGGRLIFSTERLADIGECGFKLNVSGRYSHHQDYLMRRLDDAGFTLEKCSDIDIRTESGIPVAGQFVCAIRTE
jgi:predicted TPR repeat methyltransferase